MSACSCRPLMFEFKSVHNSLGMRGYEPINVNQVVKYSHNLAYSYSRDGWSGNQKRVFTYPFENFWRFLFGKEFLKPRKGRGIVRASINITFSNSNYSHEYYFNSNAAMEKEFKRFDDFMLDNGKKSL